MSKVLLVLMMFGWAGCTQQEEVKETRYLGVLTGERENGDIMFFTGNVPLDDSGITWWIVPPPKDVDTIYINCPPDTIFIGLGDNKIHFSPIDSAYLWGVYDSIGQVVRDIIFDKIWENPPKYIKDSSRVTDTD